MFYTKNVGRYPLLVVPVGLLDHCGSVLGCGSSKLEVSIHLILENNEKTEKDKPDLCTSQKNVTSRIGSSGVTTCGALELL